MPFTYLPLEITSWNFRSNGAYSVNSKTACKIQTLVQPKTRNIVGLTLTWDIYIANENGKQLTCAAKQLFMNEKDIVNTTETDVKQVIDFSHRCLTEKLKEKAREEGCGILHAAPHMINERAELKKIVHMVTATNKAA